MSGTREKGAAVCGMDSSECSETGAGAEAHTLLTGLQSQTDHLLRRVQRLQTRQCERHLHNNMQSFVRQQQTGSAIGCQLRKVRDSHSNGRIKAPVDPMRFLHRDGVKHMPTSALVDFVRTWEQNHSLTATADSYADAEATPSADPNIAKLLPPAHTHSQQPVDRTAARKTESAAGQLRSNIQHMEQEYDSDATESSSGGESGDDGFGSLDVPVNQHSASMKKNTSANP